jgi:maltose phosphorylase
MNIVYGFGGMRSDGEMLTFNPTIPAHWKSYSFQVLYRGSVIRVETSQHESVARVVQGKPVTVKICGEMQTIGAAGISTRI